MNHPLDPAGTDTTVEAALADLTARAPARRRPARPV
jgi:hypothetical protein